MSAVGLSAEESEWLNTDPTIKVGYIDGCLPYADMDEETGEVVGMLPAFMEQYVYVVWRTYGGGRI